jgi:hypothetical protein
MTACAGIQFIAECWIPAFAGMTAKVLIIRGRFERS